MNGQQVNGELREREVEMKWESSLLHSTQTQVSFIEGLMLSVAIKWDELSSVIIRHNLKKKILALEHEP